jgi:hypothetical protein
MKEKPNHARASTPIYHKEAPRNVQSNQNEQPAPATVPARSARATWRAQHVSNVFDVQLFPQSALPTSGHRMNPRCGAILICRWGQMWSSFHYWMVPTDGIPWPKGGLAYLVRALASSERLQ